MTRFRRSRPNDSGSRSATLASRDEVTQHSTAFTRLMSLGQRYGIDKAIMRYTVRSLRHGEVFSIRGDETDRMTGLAAYACSKARKAGTLDAVAQAIINEGIESQTRELRAHEDAAKNRGCIIFNKTAPLAGSTAEEVRETLENAKPMVMEALDALADLCDSAGEQAHGVVVQESFLAKLGLPEKTRIQVINKENPEVCYDLLGNVLKDADAERALSKEVGKIMSATLKIWSDVSSRHMSERPLVRFEVHVTGHAGMKKGGPAELHILPGETRQEAIERTGRIETRTADFRDVKAEKLTAGLDKRDIYHVGRDPSDKVFGIQSLLRGATKPWLAERQLVLVFMEDALIVADIGQRKMRMPQQ